MISPYPSVSGILSKGKLIRTAFATERKNMGLVMKLIRDIRTSRNEMNVSQSKRTALYIKPLGANQSLIGKTAALIEKLAGGNKTEIVSAAPDGKTSLSSPK